MWPLAEALQAIMGSWVHGPGVDDRGEASEVCEGRREGR